ncbi:MAG: acetylornithine transaminase [Clostridia bacterium]|nr:acetylornithine transaminase [Clostridia bacterium]
MDYQALDKTYIAHTYARFPVHVVSGKGSLLKDADGKTYIDLGSGIGVTAFGIGDDEWIQAVTAQLGLVQHTSNLYYTDPCMRLAQMLCEKTGMKKVFFGNSGAEANECAIKTARKYAQDKHGVESPVIVTLKNGFHGRTVTTLAATGQEHYHELFQPLTPGFVYAEPNQTDETIALIRFSKASAVLIECIQGEGGVNVLDKAYVQSVAAYCKENDVLLIVDEVQTGNGRTGKLYAYMNYDIVPDLVSTAKGLGGGLPLGACLFGEKVENVLGFGDHGSTFGGNPVCCAGGVSILSRLNDAFLQDVKRKGDMVKMALTGAPGVEYVGGMGLMIGIKTVKKASDVVSECIQKGVLCLTAKDKVRLLPALNIPDDLLMKAVQVIKDACNPG